MDAEGDVFHSFIDIPEISIHESTFDSMPFETEPILEKMESSIALSDFTIPTSDISVQTPQSDHISKLSEDTAALQQSFMGEFETLKESAKTYQDKIHDISCEFKSKIEDLDAKRNAKNEECAALQINLKDSTVEIEKLKIFLVEVRNNLDVSVAQAEMNRSNHQSELSSALAQSLKEQVSFKTSIAERDTLIATSCAELENALSTVALLEANLNASANDHASQEDRTRLEKDALEERISVQANQLNVFSKKVISLETALRDSSISSEEEIDTIKKLEDKYASSLASMLALQTALNESEATVKSTQSQLDAIQKSSQKSVASITRKLTHSDTALATQKSNHALELHEIKNALLEQKIDSDATISALQKVISDCQERESQLHDSIVDYEKAVKVANEEKSTLRAEVERLVDDGCKDKTSNEVAVNDYIAQIAFGKTERNDLGQQVADMNEALRVTEAKHVEAIEDLSKSLEAELACISRLTYTLVERDSEIDTARLATIDLNVKLNEMTVNCDRMNDEITKQALMLEEMRESSEVSSTVLKGELSERNMKVSSLTEINLSVTVALESLESKQALQSAIHEKEISEMTEVIQQNAKTIEDIASLLECTRDNIVAQIQLKVAMYRENASKMAAKEIRSATERQDTLQLLSNIDAVSAVYESDVAALSRLVDCESTNDLGVISEKLTAFLESLHVYLHDHISDSIVSEASIVFSVALIENQIRRLNEKKRVTMTSKFDSAVDVDGVQNSQEFTEKVEGLVAKLQGLLELKGSGSIKPATLSDELLLHSMISSMSMDHKLDNKTLHASNTLLKQSIRGLRKEVKTATTEFALHLNRALLQSAQFDKAILDNQAMKESISERDKCVVGLVERLSKVQSGYERQATESISENKLLSAELSRVSALHLRAEERMEILLGEFRRQDDVIKSLRQLVKSVPEVRK